jgi:hypothetical protein
MVLPPMEKHERKCVHELAREFGLASKSKGCGKGRFTALTKTTRTRFTVNEHTIAKILRNAQAESSGRARDGGSPQLALRGKGKGRVTVPRHREGDEVGKVCRSYRSSLTKLNAFPSLPGGAEDWRV